MSRPARSPRANSRTGHRQDQRAALAAASLLLPRTHAAIIDGFSADRGIIREGYSGILSAPPDQRPHALEIVFETPGSAPLDLQVKAAVVAVKTILSEYRQLLALGQNL
jgi:protein MpaA